MGSFRRVDGGDAGPRALGILVPPARRTFLILRPRALSWDLLLLRQPGSRAFRQLAHDEASFAAQGAYRALGEWSAGGEGRVEVVADPQGPGFWVRATLGALSFAACPRVPGQPYQPLVCAEYETARTAALALAGVLHPPEGAEQEVYFNTRFFEPTAAP
jgi:hypothetical protein